MTAPTTFRSRWLSGTALWLHASLVVVCCGCLAAGGFELSRALAGNELSWVYVFEWPFFAAFSGRIWWRLLHEDDAPRPARRSAPPATVSAPLAVGADDDEELRAWREYQARLHAQNPPGGPPARR